MARYGRYDYGYPEYVPVSEKKWRNQQSAAKLRKSNQAVQPVTVNGRSIASTWWGKSWNANLERYADYSNRIGRGRSYLRHGAVLDLQIEGGQATALVQGSRSRPYKVEIKIKPLAKKTWGQLREAALVQLDSLADLLAGKFPEALREAFFARGDGLFPSPREIQFDCSCPDWASMCKHVAAALYGIGNRLDNQPEMLFSLRQVAMDELIAKTVDATAEQWLNKADGAAGDDILEDADIAEVFGIEFEETGALAPESPAAAAPKTSSRGKGKAETKAKVKKAGKTRQRQAAAVGKGGGKPRAKAGSVAKAKPQATRGQPKSKSAKQPSQPVKPTAGSMVEQLTAAAPRTRQGFDLSVLRKKLPAWSKTQVSNTLQRAIREGALERVSFGLYRRPKGSPQ